MGNATTKKRRGFTIRDDNSPTTPSERRLRLHEHQHSKTQLGPRKAATLKHRLINQIGPSKYDELLKSLEEVTKR